MEDYNKQKLEDLYYHLIQFQNVNKKIVNYIYVNKDTYEKIIELAEEENLFSSEIYDYFSTIHLAIDNNLEDGQIGIG